MSPSRYRVVQWATGNTGQRALREVIRHPALDLVGVKVYDPAKDGVDAGDLCGESRTGIAATTDREAMFALKPNCVLYMARAAGPSNARIGLTIPEVLDDVVTLLESGANVMTTVTDFHAGGNPRLGEEGFARLRAACERGNSSLYANGTDPGLVSDQIALALLSAQRLVQSVEIIEYGDVSQRPSHHMIFEQLGFGKPLAEFSSEQWAAHLHDEFVPTLRMLADAAGLTVDGSSARGEVAAAREDTSIVAGTVKAGTVAGQRFIVALQSGGKDVVRLDQYAYVTKDLDPAWDIREVGWRVRVDGDAPWDVDLPFAVPLDRIGQFVPAYNANLSVNAIPYLCAAPPGILTVEDLPPILPRGPRPRR